jgi:hypothetical protein
VKDSLLNTVSVPALGSSSQSNAILAYATTNPTRVQVRNVGAVTVFIAHDSSELPSTGAVTQGGTYQLPTGNVDVFVLAPGQGLFAAGSGGTGTVSVAVSESIPIKDWLES